MTSEENIPLSHLTTFKAGGPATLVVHATKPEDVAAGIELARARNISFYPLGEGSNVLPSDEGYGGVIVRIEIPGIEFVDDGERMLVTAGAGVHWDELVAEAASRGLWGIENLAGIPGTCGAAPVQNIGAYGAELRDTLHSVEAYDASAKAFVTLKADECKLAYRDSRFKHEPNLVITKMTLALAKEGLPRIEYGDLLRAREEGVDLTTPSTIGEAVRAIRSGKFPSLDEYGTAGSFFKNPVLSQESYDALTERYGAVPRFPNPAGIKVPLAFILDKALSLRGYRQGRAWLFGAQPLVLVLDKNSDAKEVEELARYVEARVHEATGITIEREVRSMPLR